MPRDEVYRDPRNQLVDFAFDAGVAAVFPDMIRRSVPGYELVVPMSGLLATRNIDACGTRRIYDLGCSLGATTLALLRGLGTAEADILAVDNAPAMLAKARVAVSDPRVQFVEADVTGLVLEPAAAVVMNWIQQFLPPQRRDELLARIRAQLDPQGVLVVSEKIRAADPAVQARFDAAHLDFKRANGYSELEIAQKRAALENVMIVDTEDEHLERFAAAGFSSATKWFQCLNWASFVVTP